MTDHNHYRELAGAYALGILSADERRDVEAHLAGCPECRREVRDAEAVAEVLGQAVVPQDPPAALRDRIMAATRSEVAPSSQPPRAVSRASLAPWLLAAASFTGVALGLYAWTLHARLQETEAALRAAQSRLAAIESQVAGLRRATEETGRAADVLSAPDVVRVAMAGQAEAPKASGHAFWSRSRGLVLAGSNLPALPRGRVYQLWVVTGTAKESAGLVRPDSTGRISAVATVTAQQPTAIALTIEPDGGVAQPTGAMYLVGAL